ncbi:hypothetical protein POSPLADRAFT_1050829 [Postia placenta MAD-698-R-SB12]|uniref:Uncharacterized protein n=1 Tax=Postia placenta MAD-698-R-SB12 TaxID=670580 RepID=A0A1X6MIZ5_9APHY|nr:hypothetical protein POSPLADRAFT_1050829 [Postia placenta MAD-698-R-SB12]OSX56315.1 hypothetical protein POSPLADRAFT_1050829 [Postia placenta MAD-698-R-SB12]
MLIPAAGTVIAAMPRPPVALPSINTSVSLSSTRTTPVPGGPHVLSLPQPLVRFCPMASVPGAL